MALVILIIGLLIFGSSIAVFSEPNDSDNNTVVDLVYQVEEPEIELDEKSTAIEPEITGPLEELQSMSINIPGVPSGNGITPYVEPVNDPDMYCVDAKTVLATKAKLNQDNPGVYTLLDGKITATIYRDGDYTGLNWTSTIPISYVLVKGGPQGGHMYVYNPPAYGDTGLYTPVNPSNNKPSAISHVTFYYCGGAEILGSIASLKFNDLNANGVLDGTEYGLEGWRIELYTDAAMTIPYAPNPFQLTDNTGAFSFGNLPLGTYYLKEVQQAGWAQTAPGSGYFMVELTSDPPITHMVI